MSEILTDGKWCGRASKLFGELIFYCYYIFKMTTLVFYLQDDDTALALHRSVVSGIFLSHARPRYGYTERLHTDGRCLHVFSRTVGVQQNRPAGNHDRTMAPYQFHNTDHQRSWQGLYNCGKKMMCKTVILRNSEHNQLLNACIFISTFYHFFCSAGAGGSSVP